MLRSSQLVGDYRLDRRLAVGSTAEIWMAHHRRRPGPAVALKALLGSAARDPAFAAAFLEEAAFGSKLSHRAIVRVEVCFQFDDGLFQVMELIDGPDIRGVLARAATWGHAMPPALAAFVAHEIADALAYIHQFERERFSPVGLTHRGVSSDSIMIDRDGRVRLLDFGIARARERVAGTGGRVVTRKPRYLSPERLAGAGATAACDVWARCSRRCWEQIRKGA